MELDFNEVIELVNRAGVLDIDPRPLTNEAGRWSIFSGKVNIGRVRLRHNILYLMPGLSRRTELARAIKALDRLKDPAQIVYADVLVEDGRFPSLARHEDDEKYPRLGAREFFMSLAREQLATYLDNLKLENLKNEDLRDYVDPDLEVVANGHDIGDQTSIRDAILGPIKKYRHDPELSVLIAEPGQGKTYVCRYIAQRAASMGLIPLLVASDQWGNIPTTDLQSLWKVIVNAFQHYGAPIFWADGAEESFVRVAQKTGLFMIIFDAFDEYVLRASGSIAAPDVLNAFRELALSTSSHILLTSRTAFWESGSDEVFAGFRDEEFNARCFKIRPFDKRHARTYFGKRLATKPEYVDPAMAVFADLKRAQREGSVDFAGRGFLVYLIADMFLRGGHASEALDVATGGLDSPLDWVCERFCQREDRRQGLGLSASVQLAVLEELAEAVMAENGASTGTLSLLLEVLAEADAETVKILVGADGEKHGKLAYHPLLRQRPDNRWIFCQDQIHYLFLARRVLSLIQNDSPNPLKRFLDAIRGRQQLQVEVAGMLLQLLLTANTGISHLRAVSAALIEHEPRPTASHSQDHSGGASIAARLAVLAISEILPRGDKIERRQLLLDLAGKESIIERMQFSDTLSNLDLRGVTFRHCRFENVTIMRSEFDATTRFENCRFVGVDLLKSPSFVLSSIAANCSVDVGLRRHIVVGTMESGKRRYGLEDLRADMELILLRLLPSDALPPARVSLDQIDRGRIATSPLRDEIIAALRRNVIEEVPSNDKNAPEFHLRRDVVSAVRYHRSNGVFVGGLADAWNEVRQKI
jgi:hypothetical protein